MPRAELVAVIQVVCSTFGDITVYTDHKNIVTGMRLNPEKCAFLTNNDLWEDLWAAVASHQGSVTVLKVPAHASEEDVILSEVPKEAIIGNFIADAVACRGSKMAELPEEVVDRVKALKAKALLVLGRAVVVSVAAASLHKNPERSLKPPSSQPRPLHSLKKAKRDSGHSVVALARAWRCTRCLGVSPRKGVAAWFMTPCPGSGCDIQALELARAPHPTHSLERGPALLWCKICGAWSKGRYGPALMGPCPRRPSSSFHAYTLSRLRRGLEPLPSPAGAAPLGMVLEIV